jgi:hypothetical protein
MFQLSDETIKKPKQKIKDWHMVKETTGGGGLAEGLSEVHNKYSRKKEERKDKQKKMEWR